MSKPKVIIYHGGNCRDGWCSAWLFHLVWPDAEYIPANYGSTQPDVTGKSVYIADFSYQTAEMVALIKQADGDVVVLDHHKTAEDSLNHLMANLSELELGSQPRIIFDQSHSGAVIVWNYLNEIGAEFPDFINANIKDGIPRLVRYVEDHDLYKFLLPSSKDFRSYLRTVQFDFDEWDGICKKWSDTNPMSFSGFCEIGRKVLAAEQIVIDTAVRHASEIVIAGYTVLATCTAVYQSEVAGKLAEGRPFGACFFDTMDGLRIWSLRSAPDGVEVDVVAKRFGGGGHKRSAGFQQFVGFDKFHELA